MNRDIVNPGGMLSPTRFEPYEAEGRESTDWENSYELDPEYSPEGVEALGDMFGREVEPDGGYRKGTLGSMDHESPLDELQDLWG